MDTEYTWAAVWVAVVICVTILIISLANLYNQRLYKFVDAGYTQKTLVGADYPRWVKE